MPKIRKAYFLLTLLITALLVAGACTPPTPPEPEVKLTAPKLLSPDNEAAQVQLRPILLWEAVPEAKVYELKLSRNSALSDLVHDVLPVNASYQPSTELEPLTRYYWMVCAKLDPADPNKACSEVWAFTTAEKTETTTPLQPPPLPEPLPSSPEPIKITAQQLSTEYDAIGLAAETRYKNVILEVSGTFGSLDLAIEEPFIRFETEPGAWDIYAFIPNQEVTQAEELKKGDEITITGVCRGSTVLAIILADCHITSP